MLRGKDKEYALLSASPQFNHIDAGEDELFNRILWYAAKGGGQGKYGDKVRARQLRVGTTDPEARVMKMANGGFDPAVNVQLAADTQSRAILGVEVSHEGYDAAGLMEPMRQQVEQRTGGKVEQHVVDGGYLRMQDIEDAEAQGVELFVPLSLLEISPTVVAN